MILRSLLAASAVLLIALPARAEPRERPAHQRGEVTLDYLPNHATIDLCPSEDYLHYQVQLRIGYDLFQPIARQHLTVKVSRVNDLFHAIAELRDGDGEIILSDYFDEHSCAAVIQYLTIVVATHFTFPPEECPPCPSAPLPLAPSAPAPPSAAAVPPLPLSERPRFQVGLASAFAIGKAPIVLGGVGWSLGVRWRDYSAALEGRALFAPSAEVDGIPLSFSFVAASGLTCLHYTWALVCVRVEVGSLSGNSGKGQTYPKHAPSSGVAMRVAGDWVIAPVLALRPYFEVMAEIAPSRMIDTDRVAPLWSSPSLSVSLGLGLIMSRAGLSKETKK